MGVLYVLHDLALYRCPCLDSVMDPEDVKRMDTLNQNKRYSDVSEAFGHGKFVASSATSVR